jgi:hypothetical protein
LVIHPELVIVVVFSQKYSVQTGLPLAVQLARMQLSVTFEKEATLGGLAKVYLEADGE